jgi:iron complex outermembrane receptor protein
MKIKTDNRSRRLMLTGRTMLALSGFAVGVAAAEESATLQEVTVSAKSTEDAERREAGSQKVILGRKDIENMSAMTVGEVMGKLPGIEMTSNGMGPRARGMSRDSVQIMIDGERQPGGAMAVSGALGRLPSSDIERVEILRGSSAEFGGSSSVTVNLVLKKAVPKRSTEVRVGAGYRGSEPNYQLAWTENGGEGGFAWSLPLSLVWSNSPGQSSVDRQSFVGGGRNLWQQDNEQSRTRLGHHSFAPKLTWKDGLDSLTVAPLYFWGPMDKNSSTALTAYANPVAGNGLATNGSRASVETAMTKLYRVRVDGEKHVGDSKLTMRMGLNRTEKSSDVNRDARDAANVLTNFIENNNSTDREVNTAVRLDMPNGLHLLSVSAEYIKLMRDQSQTFAGGFVSQAAYQAAQREGVVWVQDEWTPETGNLTLTSGLRGESMGLASDGITQQRGALLPSIAVRWEPIERWTLRSSLGAGMKMPKLDEISNASVRAVTANTPVEPDQRGNPNLRAERSINFEAVAERYLAEETGVLGVNVYARSTQDFVERQALLEGARWVDRPYNQGSATHWGVEMDGKLRSDMLGWKGGMLKMHLTLPYSRVDDTRLGAKRMARDTPFYVMSTGIDQGLPSLSSSVGLTLQLSGRSRSVIPGEQYIDTRSRATLDAFWLYKVDKGLNLRLSGQNLLQPDGYRTNHYVQGANEWQTGNTDRTYRTVMFTVEGRW